MSNNLIKIMFSRNLMRGGYLSVSAMKTILENLPEDTKLLGFCEEQNRDCASLLVDNHCFPEVPVGNSIPEVIYTYDAASDRHNFKSNDLGPEMVETLFPHLVWKEVQEEIKPASLAECSELVKSIYAPKFQEVEMDWLNKSIWASSAGQPFVIWGGSPEQKKTPLYGDAASESLGEAGLEITKEDFQKYIKGTFTTISTPCNHSWKTYEGLSEKFDYCEHCQEKKI